jgi:putative glycosyltransferase (TIGR04372 family)
MNTESRDDGRLQELWRQYNADPDAYESNRNLGLHLAATEQFKLDAYPFLIKALSFGRRENQTRYMFDCLGNICNLTGLYDQAAELYGEAYRRYPLTHDFAMRLGDAHFRLGDPEKASFYYAHVIGALYNWARELSKKNDRKQIHVLGPNRVICAAIGEMAARPDMYLKARKLGYIDDGDAILVAPQEDISNAALLECWRDHLTIVSDPIEVSAAYKKYEKNRIYIDYLPLPDGRILRRDLAHLTVHQQWEAEGRGPLIAIPEEKMKWGWAELKKLGMPEGAWFVCLHVREPGFYAETTPWNRNRLRNADIATYLPAIESITSAGGWVVRIGDATMTPLPDLPNVIDLATRYQHRDWMDVFCIAECRFLLATTSGPHNVADAFGTPIVGTNWFALGYWPLSKNDIFIHKLLRDQKSGRILSLEESLRPPLFGAWEPMLYERMGIEVLDNSAEDILAATEEMLSRRQDGNAPSAADETRQRRFRDIADPYQVGLSARPGQDFLEHHPELLG